ETHVFPLIQRSSASTSDKLHTYVEHCARLIGKDVKGKNNKVLVTGGGAWNSYLMERIRWYADNTITLPDPGLIAFKEAFVFAFLGLLRMRNEVNTLCSVTGSRCDSSGGSIWSGEKG
ncbi:MAG TPA: anhydro-N-acetylmuramic acid kinase, partial [Bacteroidia bacterium]|nr:anhydro-N-acetylmuramic acid kinase [Bacteroidia bacterium]